MRLPCNHQSGLSHFYRCSGESHIRYIIHEIESNLQILWEAIQSKTKLEQRSVIELQHRGNGCICACSDIKIYAIINLFVEAHAWMGLIINIQNTKNLPTCSCCTFTLPFNNKVSRWDHGKRGPLPFESHLSVKEDTADDIYHHHPCVFGSLRKLTFEDPFLRTGTKFKVH